MNICPKSSYFCDPGIDDTMALLLAFFIDEIEIIGIVADYGNVPKKMAVQNAHFLTNETRNRNIKIFGGSERPLTGACLLFTEVHGKQGLGPIIPNGNVTNGEMENFFEVIPLIEQYKDELIIVSLGRLTSLAILFIMCKQLMKQIKSYYVMGGAFYILVTLPLFPKLTFMATLLLLTLFFNPQLTCTYTR